MSGIDGVKAIFLKGKKAKLRKKRKPILKSISAYNKILIVGDTDVSILKTKATETFKNATIYTLVERKEKEDKDSSEENFSYHFSDLSLFGKIKDNKLTKIFAIEFDLIIDLSSLTVLNSYVLEKLNYSFMIGKSNSDKSNFYDLLVNSELSDIDFMQAAIKHITILNQNGNN